MNKHRKDTPRQHPTQNQCTLKPEEPPNGGISKDFSPNFTPNRFQTGRLAEFGVKCRLFGGERGWRAHQRQPIPANPSQAMVEEPVL
ncbi:transposase [Corynebacterium diphtheriae]